MTNLRAEMLASTVLASLAFSAPALAQDTQPTDPAASQPTGPVEAQPAPAVSSQGEAVETGQEIIVTGSRLPQPNLESSSPITVVSNQDVKLSGATRMEDVLNQLPSVGAAQTAGQSNGASGVAEVDLRSFGAKRTLVLVDGRRLMPGDPNSSNQSADINVIPAALLRRVEVLTGGASSVYGADAVAGVVNFIMDTNFEGIRFDGTYSAFQHNEDNPFVAECVSPLNGACVGHAVGDRMHIADLLNAPNRLFPVPTGSVSDGRAFDGTVTIGTAFDDGRGHAVAYFGYRNVKPVLQRDRDYSACVIQNTAAGNPQCGGSATAAPGNAIIFSDGTSTIAALGPGTITVGGQNLFNFAPLNYYQRPDERYIAGTFADYEISSAFRPYLEFMFMDDHTLAQIAPSGDFGNTFVMNCDNPLMSAQQFAAICANPDNLINGFLGSYPLAAGAPFNPDPGAPPLLFPNTVPGGAAYNRAFFQLLRRNVEGGPRINDLRHTSFRGVLGMRGDLSSVFSYDSYFQYGRTNYTQVFRNELSVSRLNRALDVIDDPRTPGVDPVCRSFVDGSDPACLPYDIFGPAGPSAASVNNYLNVFGIIEGLTSEQVANFNISGALGELGVRTPWADDGVSVNVGVEYRREALTLNPDQSFQSADLAGQGAATLPVNGNFRVWEVFGEAQLPIVRNGFVDELSFGLGYRKSWYKTSAGRTYDTDTYKLSAEFAPIDDIRFRGAYNRAVRAPNIQELFAPPFVGLSGSNDPCASLSDAAGNPRPVGPNDFGCLAQGLVVGQSPTPNPAGQYNALLGGNPDLQPEKGTTWTVGTVIQPRFIPRFALTVDYFNIKLEDAIQGFGADAIALACVTQSTSATDTSPACDLIHRDPGGSLWLVPGGQPGNGFIDNLPNNVGKMSTSGVDVNASYAHPLFNLGRLGWSFVGTYTAKYKVDNGLTQPYDCAGLYGPTCSGFNVASSAPVPKWRHKLRATWDSSFGLGLSLQWRRMGKVRAETLEDNESIGGDFNFEPGLHIKAQDYLDLAATYTLLDRVHLRAGINNLTDNDPPLVTSGNANRSGSNLCPSGPCNGNTYPGTWDALGRYLYVGATIDFLPPRPAAAPAPAAPPPPPPPPPPPATQTCPDGSVVLATDACPAPPPPPPPPPAPERG